MLLSSDRVLVGGEKVTAGRFFSGSAVLVLVFAKDRLSVYDSIVDSIVGSGSKAEGSGKERMFEPKRRIVQRLFLLTIRHESMTSELGILIISLYYYMPFQPKRLCM